MTKVYILLPVHNRKEITRHFIECLKAQSYSNYHLLLIDDGSTDGTSEMVLEYIPTATVLRGNGDWWWAGCLQCGLEWLKENINDNNALILFINDDVQFSPDYLEQACQVMSDKKGVLVLSRNRKVNSLKIIETGVYADLKHLSFKIAEAPEKINCLSTRGLFVHWTDVLAIGDFHPKLLPHYLSDYEFTMRAHQKGFKCETSAVLLIEPNNETTGYHLINNECFIDFIKKYFSKKSTDNPVYWSSFIFLRSRSFWLIVNLIQVWRRAVKSIFQSFLASKRSCSHQ
jgi:GT2 family glycosyltransferase